LFTGRHWLTVGVAGVCILTGGAGLVSAALAIPSFTSSTVSPDAGPPEEVETPPASEPPTTPAKPETTKPSPQPSKVTPTRGAQLPGAVQPQLAQDRSCKKDAAITLPPYWINNNQWGATTGSGSQCVFRTSDSGSTIGWGTSWDWTGSPNSVKSFPSAVMGWHWGVQVPGSGLPVRLSEDVDVESKWSFSLKQEGEGAMNVMYDLWLHDIANPGGANDPTAEVTVWLNRTGDAAPAGTREATVTIDGTKWDLFRATNATWDVYSFVRTSDTTSASLNLKDFTDELTRRGLLSQQKYLTSVEAGAQIFTGEGRLDTSQYSVRLGSPSAA
jgi:xyloglucan-specific endo-beta-1,4-glucanase